MTTALTGLSGLHGPRRLVRSPITLPCTQSGVDHFDLHDRLGSIGARLLETFRG